MFKHQWQQWKRRLKREAAMLAWARREMLARAPYGYGHFQGEDGYRIWDTRLDPGFVGFSPTTELAENWIIEQFLAENDQAGSETASQA